MSWETPQQLTLNWSLLFSETQFRLILLQRERERELNTWRKSADPPRSLQALMCLFRRNRPRLWMAWNFDMLVDLENCGFVSWNTIFLRIILLFISEDTGEIERETNVDIELGKLTVLTFWRSNPGVSSTRHSSLQWKLQSHPGVRLEWWGMIFIKNDTQSCPSFEVKYCPDGSAVLLAKFFTLTK